ncbi:translation initiation inhibitor [Pandoraea faecigallinarum]|uniref:Translation initiation inhibitor n=1 Tax=Pandoraea faecigallinarum TaxID=656179 RepID=A0A0H3WTB5_9BURK|nr:RidA family protein [Pandoraea faecigallinarum]AKM31459.1 translation initiation inhibitor [Pandoraea faecigallinarum]
MQIDSPIKAERIRAQAVPDLGTATWTNGIRFGNEILMSGMTAHPATRDAQKPLTAYEQTLVVLGKIRALVEAGGGSLANIYKLVVYVTDIADKDEVGRARREFFAGVAAGGGAYPCSTLVEVSALVFPELRVEIEAFARLDIDLSVA